MAHHLASLADASFESVLLRSYGPPPPPIYFIFKLLMYLYVIGTHGGQGHWISLKLDYGWY